MKRLATLIIFAGFLLSSCAVSSATATEIHTSKVEQITSEIAQVIQETTAGSTQAQSEITHEQTTTDTAASEPQNSTSSGYWRWASPADGEKQIKAYPKDVVRIFEKNGFIWGGKWNHFDIFHFEYRPEMIIKAKYFPGKADMSMPWYQGANLHEESVKKYIALIDRSTN